MAPIAGELVALQLADEAGAGIPLEDAADRDQLRVGLQFRHRDVQELRHDRGVGVHHTIATSLASTWASISDSA